MRFKESLERVDRLIGEGNYDAALDLLDDLLKHPWDDTLLPSALWRRGWILYLKGKLHEAAQDFEEAVRMMEDLPPNFTLAFVLSTSGIVHHTLREFENALHYHERALRILEELYATTNGDPYTLLKNLAQEYNNRANTLVGLGRLDEALQDYDTALHLAERLLERDPKDIKILHLIANLHYNVGSIYYYTNDIQRACHHFKVAFENYRRLCNRTRRTSYCDPMRKLEKSLQRGCILRDT
ncbi:MAG: tetratricopeptide repeat protein [Thermotogae bacterium]|nr:tetratricopeptide repeat protein [Thermotogota bacterium]